MEVRPGYKLTEVGVIPDEWEVSRLHDLAQIRSGIAKNSNVAVNDPVIVHYLRVANVQDGFLDLSEMSKIAISRTDLKRYAVLPGDVLMNEGGDLDKLGRGSIWIGQLNLCVHQNHVFVVRCGSRLRPEYLNAWSGAAVARRYFMVAGKQTTNLASINKTALGELPVATPCLPEQRAIAAVLSDVDRLLDGLDRLIAKKRDLKQATMQQLLTGWTRLPGFHRAWEVKRLGEIAALNRVNIVPALRPNSPFTHFSLPAFDAGSRAEVELGSSIGSNKFCVPTTAVLVSKLNPRIPRIWAPRSIPENAVASTEWLVLTPRHGINRQYLFTLCSSLAFCEQMELAATGTTGSHQRISPNTALDIQIAVTMDPSEQVAVATVLSDLDAELSDLEAKRDKTRMLKQGMMQELLTGKTRLVSASSNVVSADFTTKPKPAQLQRSATKPHNWQINEAVVVAVLVKQFGSEQYPLGRKRCTKLAYLLHRHVEHVTEGYLKKAAGPYNPAVKYKGPEGIAQKNGYIRAHRNGNYSGFVAADKIGQAEDYFDKWYGQEALDWLEQFRKKSNDELELLATVDMAVEDVKRVNAKVSVAAVKSVIHDHPEWEAKLEREIFSDANIARTIRRVSELFSTE